MIAPARPASTSNNTSNAHDQFVAMLPQIRRKAAIAFHELDAEAREDAIQEAIANCFVAFTRLVELSRSELAYATPLADYAIKQLRDGRRVGGRLSVRDVMSRHAQRVKGFRVVSLDMIDSGEDEVRAALVEDKTAGPADTAAARIDVAQWFRLLSRRKRRVAKLLAVGETTKEVARCFRVSTARISQLRQELRRSWMAMLGE